MCQALRRVARQMSKRYDDALRPLGLKAGQFTILASLLRDRPVPLTGLARGLGMDRTTLTKDLQPLVQRGLVQSFTPREDARVRALALTDAGRALLSQAVPLWSDAQRVTEHKLGDGRWPGIRSNLDRMIA